MTGRIMVIVFFIFLGCSAAIEAWAEDMIEVKDRGFMSGKIVKEDEKEVTFTGPDGATEVFARSEILFLEKSKTAPVKFSMPANPFSASAKSSKPRAGSKGVSKAPPPSMDFRRPPTSIRDAISQWKRIVEDRQRYRQSQEDLLTKMNLWIEGVELMRVPIVSGLACLTLILLSMIVLGSA